MPLASQGTFWLVSDAPSASPAAPPAPNINLNFPDAHFGSAIYAVIIILSLNAKVGCERLPASGVEAGTDCRRGYCFPQ